MAAGNRWTLGDDDALRQLWAEGIKPPAIADRFGRALSSVLARAHRLGLAGRRQKGENWSAEEDATLLAARRELGSVERVFASGRLPGRSRGAIQGRLAALRAGYDGRGGAAVTLRQCMSCPTTIASEGAHHRMCASCRHRAENISPYEPDFGRATAIAVPRRSGA